jgi:probable F420-dependent oxidoreductase
VDEQLPELGFYTLAGHSTTPRDLVDEVADAERLGLGAVFISERFNVKEAAVLSGAAGAVSSSIGIATAATNPNTRNPLVTAAMATTMHRLTGGRFALGVGRGGGAMTRMGLRSVDLAQLEDFAGLMRRLWSGEAVVDHDGPCGRYEHLLLDPSFAEDIPLILATMGERTAELAGRVFDGLVLHTFFSDETLARYVAAARHGAEVAGRDPDDLRIWSVLATVGDHVAERDRLVKLAGRLGTYLLSPGYGDVLARANRWDEARLATFRSDPVMRDIRGLVDATASLDQLRHIDAALPREWLAAAATGSPDRCAARILDQFDAGATDVILHGATPAELAPVVRAYRTRRPLATRSRVDANPGQRRAPAANG